MVSSIALPRLMKVGGGASTLLPAILRELGLSRPFLVTDSYMASTEGAKALLAGLKAAGIHCSVFSGVEPDPTVATVESALGRFKEGDHDCVVGFGGGSPIDTAKALAIVAVHGGPVSKYKVPHLQETAGLPIIAIPTTAGTGSEATRFTVVTDGETDEKMLLCGSAYVPMVALVDFELTLSAPRRLSADTGIDALTHAIEGYVTRRANPFSDALALSAMRSIAPNLRKVWADPGDRGAREAMMMGATHAGIAFSNSSVALVHGMSRPIGAHFHVAHGLSNAMLLPEVTAFSAPGASSRYADCAIAMGCGDKNASDEAKVDWLLTELRSLNQDLEVPSPRFYGLDEKRWHALAPLMAQQALASGSPANNPVIPREDDIVSLYQRVWAA